MALTSTGLQIRRLPEVLRDLVTSEQNSINSNISTQEDTFLGQLNTIVAAAIADQEALAQSVNDNFNLQKAEGRNLDDLAALTGVVRITGANSSTTFQRFTGDNGTTIPAGTILENPITLDRFTTLAAIELSVASCVSATYRVETLLNSTAYTMLVNGVSYTYTSDSDATNLEVLQGLQALIAADATATWTATVDTPNETLVIATSDTNNIAIVTTTFIGASQVVNQGSAQAVNEGLIVAPSNAVTNIITAVAGLTSTTNTAAYTVGRDRETDTALRARALVSQQLSGAGTVEAIRDTLNNLSGVTAASVIENTSIMFAEGKHTVTFTNVNNSVNITNHGFSNGDPVQFSTTGTLPSGLSPQDIQYWIINATTNTFQVAATRAGVVVPFLDNGTGTHSALVGRPPKSFESIVQGGTDEQVGLSIWQTKPAGILPFGASSVVVNDSQGNPQTIGFTRPTAVNLAFEIEYSRLDEETFPADGRSVMAQSVVTNTNVLGIDADVIPSRYFGNIYSSVSGIDSLVIRVQVIANPGDSPNPSNWQTTRLPINEVQFANTTSADVVVLEV